MTRVSIVVTSLTVIACGSTPSRIDGGSSRANTIAQLTGDAAWGQCCTAPTVPAATAEAAKGRA
jgi:hypothetical protein